MKSGVAVILGLITILSGSFAMGEEPTVAEVTHWQLQAVDAAGVATYLDTDKVTVAGILLNNPEEMLDPTPSGVNLGGQWQVFIQGEGNDHAGTAVWLGQNYLTRGGTGNYTTQQMLDELARLNYETDSGYVIQAGDRVRVTGWYRFFGGKLNINELHHVEPLYDIQVELVTPGAGLPEPEVVALDSLKDSGNNFIFDASRLTGPEYYQARRVRLNDVTITTPQNWGPGNTVTVQDANGKTCPVKLGIGKGFSRYACPTGTIDVVGIMNQESNSGTQGMTGYEIWVVNYDGNGQVLTDRGRPRGNLAGDVNGDYVVDLQDFAELASGWLTETPGL